MILPWLLSNWRAVALVAGILALLVAAGVIVHRIKDAGRREVITETNRINQEATDAAR